MLPVLCKRVIENWLPGQDADSENYQLFLTIIDESSGLGTGLASFIFIVSFL